MLWYACLCVLCEGESEIDEKKKEETIYIECEILIIEENLFNIISTKRNTSTAVYNGKYSIHSMMFFPLHT